MAKLAPGLELHDATSPAATLVGKPPVAPGASGVKELASRALVAYHETDASR